MILSFSFASSLLPPPVRHLRNHNDRRNSAPREEVRPDPPGPRRRCRDGTTFACAIYRTMLLDRPSSSSSSSSSSATSSTTTPSSSSSGDGNCHRRDVGHARDGDGEDGTKCSAGTTKNCQDDGEGDRRRLRCRRDRRARRRMRVGDFRYAVYLPHNIDVARREIRHVDSRYPRPSLLYLFRTLESMYRDERAARRPRRR